MSGTTSPQAPVMDPQVLQNLQLFARLMQLRAQQQPFTQPMGSNALYQPSAATQTPIQPPVPTPGSLQNIGGIRPTFRSASI